MTSNGDGRVDIVLGNTGPNRVFTNQGSWIFTPGRRTRQRRQPRFRGRGFGRRQRARDRVRERQPRRDGLCLRLCDGPLPGDGTCERAGNVGGGRGPRRQRPCGPGVRPRTSEGRAVQHDCHSALRCSSPRPSSLALHRRPTSLRPTRTLTAMSTSSASMRPEATKSSRTTASASSRCAQSSSRAQAPAMPRLRSSASMIASTSPSSALRVSRCSTTTAPVISGEATRARRLFSCAGKRRSR